jgi:hypothetical protein
LRFEIEINDVPCHEQSFVAADMSPLHLKNSGRPTPGATKI